MLTVTAGEPSSKREKERSRDLPIVRIAIEAVILPFQHLDTFANFVWIPTLANAVVSLLAWVLAYYGMSQNQQRVISWIVNTLAFTPFAVAWFRLILLGPQSIARRPVFAVGKVELQYLAAYALLVTAVAVTVGFPAMLMQSAHIHYYVTHESLPLTGAAVIVGATIAIIMCIRCSFVFPAIAIQRYAGFEPALRQTRGYFERMLAIDAIALGPWFVVARLVDHVGNNSWQLITAGLDIVGVGIHTFEVATVIGTVALSYKFLIFGRASSQQITQPIAAAN